MKLLAWDTSSKAAALVALEWDAAARPEVGAGRFDHLRKVAEWSLDVDAGHSERLLWAIDGLLSSARWKIEDVDVLGVGVGPGSFTGLRIGLTTARTLAHTLGKPLVPVSSLAALARPAALSFAGEKERTLIIAATDACKGELFALWGHARSVADCAVAPEEGFPGLWKRGVEERVLGADELIPHLKKKLAEGTASKKTRWIVVGEARTRYRDLWKMLPKSSALEAPSPFLDRVQGWSVGVLAWEAYQAGLSRPALEIAPRYLRASDAELKLRAGALPPGPTRGLSEEAS